MDWEGEREGRRKEREREGEKEGGEREGGRGEFGHFCGRMCKLIAHWHGLLDVPAKISLPNGRSYTPVVTPGTLAWLPLHPS